MPSIEEGKLTMKERPILFSGEMVKAILEGRKTQTRRLLKFPKHIPEPERASIEVIHEDGGGNWIGWSKDAPGLAEFTKRAYPNGQGFPCPYGKPGDRLWVRETMKCDSEGVWRYAADNEIVGCDPDDESAMIVWVHHKDNDICSAIHMPRWASRIALEITGVGVQHLQGICDADILAEGLTQELVERVIAKTARKFKTKPEHWIHGWDEGISFCRECAEKKVAELLKEEPKEYYFVAGGYGNEGDSQAYCDTCHHPLDNSYTDYCCEQELDHFAEYPFSVKSPSDCHSLQEILSAQLWEGGQLSAAVQRLSFQAVWDYINIKAAPWASNPFIWAIQFKPLEETNAQN
jgi:hypothetical protein